MAGKHFDNTSARLAAKASPENKPVRIPISVIPICRVLKKLSGLSESSNALVAFLLPCLCSISNLLFLALTTAISLILKNPFMSISTTIITISIMYYPFLYSPIN